MRVSSVGGVVQSIDGYTIIHKRPKDATHVPDVYDASIAGLAHINNNEIDFQFYLKKKFPELEINSSEVNYIKATGLHSTKAPDFSGMYTFLVQTNLELGLLAEKARNSFKNRFIIIPPGALPDFIVDNYKDSEISCLDGGVTLASSLPHQEFLETIDRWKRKGTTIEFGQLKEGIFIPD